MSKNDASKDANEDARMALAPSDKGTLSGVEFTIHPPGGIEFAEFIGEHPSIRQMLEADDALQQTAAGTKALQEFIRLAVREQAEIEGLDFTKIMRRASFRELFAFARKVLGLWAGEEGLGPFVREELTPALLIIGAKKRADQVAKVTAAAEMLLERAIDEGFEHFVKNMGNIKIGFSLPSGAESKKDSGDSSSPESPTPAV